MPRRKVGGYYWRQGLVDVIQIQRSEMADLLKLMQAAATPETGNIIQRLIDNRVECIVRLYELHGYKRDPVEAESLAEELYGEEER